MNYLIISHFFSPYSKVGAKRMNTLAQYLSDKGENVFVAKANNLEYGNDVVLDEIVNNIKQFSLSEISNNPLTNKLLRSRRYKKLVDYIIDSYSIDVVIISCGPFSYLTIIPYIKRKYPNIFSVVDIRDILDGKQGQDVSVNCIKRLGYMFDRHAEKMAVKYTDICLTVSEPMNDYYIKRYSNFQNKFLVIKNGYDDIITKKEVKDSIDKNASNGNIIDKDVVKLAIFGKFGFYSDKFYSLFADALKELKEKGVRTQVYQFGVYEQNLEHCLEQRGLKEEYNYIQTQGYEKDILKIQQCNIMVVAAHAKEALGTKVFDYIWVNRPIISMVSQDDCILADLTEEFDNGYVCKSKEDIVKAVLDVRELDSCILDNNIYKRIRYSRSKQFELFTQNNRYR